MANFKAGDRVRVVGHNPIGRGDSRHIGEEGFVTSVDYTRKDSYSVEVDLCDGRTPYWFWPHELAPLTPPAEDTWAADKVKQVTKPQHIEPVAPVTERVN